MGQRRQIRDRVKKVRQFRQKAVPSLKVNVVTKTR